MGWMYCEVSLGLHSQGVRGTHGYYWEMPSNLHELLSQVSYNCSLWISNSYFCFYFGDRWTLLFFLVNIPATREHSHASSVYLRSIDLELVQALPGSSTIRNGEFILPQEPLLGILWSWGRWEVFPFNEGESGRLMSPTPGQCSNHCTTRKKHFTEHSTCCSKWKVTASTL